MQIIRKILLVIFVPLITFTAYAGDLSLYDQPATNAKVAATVKDGQPIIPIYVQGEWLKVGDPSNGNVGWVDQKTLAAQGYPMLAVKTFGEKTANKNTTGYEIQAFNGNTVDLQKQMNTLLQDMQQQQQLLQKQFQELMQMFKN